MYLIIRFVICTCFLKLLYIFLHYRGDVVTMECVEKIIKKDWIHPLTGEKLTEKDIIPLQRVIKIFIFNFYTKNVRIYIKRKQYSFLLLQIIFFLRSFILL